MKRPFANGKAAQGQAGLDSEVSGGSVGGGCWRRLRRVQGAVKEELDHRASLN